MAARAKSFDYRVLVDGTGLARTEDGGETRFPSEWTPEHLVLAALLRCTLKSLGYHARRAGVTVSGGGEASGTVTRRDEDGRYGLVKASCRLDVALDPPLDGAALDGLPAKAERDCFVGASLRVSPRYAWRVNGVAIRL